ncbi:sigma factor [Glutamicibacter halophytocola]|uniref:RNA polymerase sigma factor n=1 Tax=Glutamicibacter halophytocola TaxID=1933880 RepID=UPI003219184C
MEPTRLAVLVGRSMEGDPEAFGELVTVMTPGLRQYCKTFFSSWHDAEDATQDAWIRAWQSLGSAARTCRIQDMALPDGAKYLPRSHPPTCQ